MGQFFKMLFASVLGFFLAMLLLLFIFIGIIFSLGKSISSKSTVNVKANSILKLNLTGVIKEQSQENTFGNIYGNYTSVLGLNDILKSIKNAKTDDDIKGIYIPMGITTTTFANLGEIRQALIDFKSSNKFIYAYGEVVNQRNYYLASVADSIFINPQGGLEFSGLTTQIAFLKGMLDKLEIEPKIFYAGKYKSATEPLRLTEMSPENELQTTEFINDLYEEMIAGISKARNIDSSLVDSISDNLLIRKPEDAIAFRFVDGLAYEDQVLHSLLNRTGQKELKDLNFITVNKYKNVSSDDVISSLKDKIAVLYAEGDITIGKNRDGIGSVDYVKHIRKLTNDDKVRAVVLRVNSPGGSALASEVIWRELQLLKEKKPLIVSMGSVAASGGYYISCMADTIIAEPTTITGSIGVFGVLPNFTKFFNNKIGVSFDGVSTGKFSNLGSPLKEMTTEEGAIIQKEVLRTYDHFKYRVGEGRDMDTSLVHTYAQGRVWTGKQAIKIGLIDLLGTKQDAISIAAKAAGIEEYRTVEYPIKKDAFTELLEEIKDDQETKITEKYLGEYAGIFGTFEYLKTMSGPQARMPYDLIIR